MPNESYEHLLHRVLDDLRNDFRRVEDKVDAQAVTLAKVLSQQLITNGNVMRHEGEIKGLISESVRGDGYAAGVKAERARLEFVGRIATKPVTWMFTGVVAFVAYIAKDRAG